MATAFPVLLSHQYMQETLSVMSIRVTILFLKHEKYKNYILDRVVRLDYAWAGSDMHMQICMCIYF